MSTTLDRNEVGDDTVEIPRVRARRVRPLELVRSHPGLTVSLAVGAAIRVLALVAYRPALLFFGDSYTYLLMAHTLHPNPQRPLVYPLFIRLLSRAPGGHNLLFLIVVQHLMGLGLGVLVYALARRYRLPKWAATLAAVPILLDAYQINIEHFVMAEILFEVLIVGGLALLVWDEKPSGPFCAIAGVLLGLAALSRTVGLAVIPFAVLFLFLKRVRIGRIVAFVAASGILVAGNAAWVGSATHNNGSAAGFFLYGRVMSFADCTRFDVPPDMMGLCDPIPAPDRPNANYYVWAPNTPAHLVPAPKGMTPDHFLRTFALNAIFGQPLDYADTVVTDFIHYFRPGHISGRLDEPGAQWRFPRALDHTQVWVRTVRLEDDSTPVIAPGPAAIVRGYQGLMFPVGPFYAVLLVLGIAGALVLIGRPSGPPAALTVTFAVVLLAVPILTTMFDYRYFLPAIPFISLAGAFGAAATWERVRGLAGRAALIGGAGLFVGGVSLAFALSSAPAVATAACARVSNLGYGATATLIGSTAQHRTQSAYLQEMYQAAADRESAVIARGGPYRQLYQLMTKASMAAANEYSLERSCNRHRCATGRLTPAEKLAYGKKGAVLAMRRVQQYCGATFPVSPPANAARNRPAARTRPAPVQAVMPSRPREA